MSERDYAVVVGISHYPGLKNPSGKEADLHAPDTDATEVYDWLIDAKGGGLRPDKIRLIRSIDFRDEQGRLRAEPAHYAIHEAFAWLEAEVRNNPEKEERPPVGRRLYVYMSGHGFAPKVDEGALLTANAMLPIQTFHVNANAWVTWFRVAGYFEESVLWMDCCAEWQLLTVPERVPWKERTGSNPPGPAFIAIAARSGKKALEWSMADGKMHGVFTWALLQGLRGAAADEHGGVTSDSLKNYLFNSMHDFLPDEVQQGLEVDIRPLVNVILPNMEFGRVAARPRYAVRLTFPAESEGQELRIWSGSPHTLAADGSIQQGQWSNELERGLYAVDVPASGLRQGFEVSGSSGLAVNVSEKGPAVDPPSPAAKKFSLQLTIKHPAATITLIDGQFERVLSSSGSTSSQQQPGVYKISAQFGRSIAAMSHRVFLLDRDLAEQLESPPLRSPVPIENAVWSHEGHVEAYQKMEARLTRGMLSTLSIVARYWTGQQHWGSGLHFPHPFEGVELVDPGGEHVTNLRESAKLEGSGGDPIATVTVSVDPGPYYVRHTLADGRILEQTLFAVPNWETQLFIRRATSDATAEPSHTGLTAIGELAILMRRPDSRNDFQDKLLEGARIALAEERNLFADKKQAGELESLLLQKFNNPIAGILGGHFLLIAIERAEATDNSERRRLLDTVVENLRNLVGDEHPDVEALSLSCSPDLRTKMTSFQTPPMFRRSWKLIVNATFERPELVPESLWERIHASMPMRPYFVWAADALVREAHEHELKSWFKKVVLVEGLAPRPAARDLLPPEAVAGAVAWEATPGEPETASSARDTIRARAVDLLLPASILEKFVTKSVSE